MFKVRPFDILREALGGYSSIQLSEWPLIYQHFARSLYLWHIKEYPHRSVPYELLNGTSSINNHHLHPLGSDFYREISRRLGKLLLHVGRQPFGTMTFCRHLRLHNVKDLERPMEISGWRPKRFPLASWFHIQGRQFKNPGPNISHPKAIWVTSGQLLFHARVMRWSFEILYGYQQDSSCWTERLYQKPKEKLDKFSDRVSQWIEDVLEPDTEPGKREEKCHGYSRAYDAIRELFWDETFCLSNGEQDWDVALANACTRVYTGGIGSRKICIDRRKLATLLKWAKLSQRK